MGQLNLKGLDLIDQLGENDTVLVNTHNGVRTLNASILGKVFANTSLFESYQMLLNNEVHSQFFTTSNKIAKYLQRDTSDIFYTEISEGIIKIRFARVRTSGSEVQTEIAHDEEGRNLYWSDNPEGCDLYDDKYPWKTEDGKVYIYPENAADGFLPSGYPVRVYSYITETLFEVTPQIDTSNRPMMTFVIGQGTDNTVSITKGDGNFSVSYEMSSGKCGFTINKVNGQALTKLYGIWDGANTQSYYTISQRLDTLNRAILYLTTDTSTQTLARISKASVQFYKAETSGNREQLLDHANRVLYWTNQCNRIENGTPLDNSGEEIHLTTVTTSWPAYCYTYSETLIGEVSIDNSATTLSISKGNSQVTLTDTQAEISQGNTLRVSMSENKGILTGDWQVKPTGNSAFTIVDAYSKDEVYTKSETYKKSEVYQKSETYGKSDVYSKNEVYSKDEVYTKSEANTQIESKIQAQTSGFYTKSEVDQLIDQLRNELSPNQNTGTP